MPKCGNHPTIFGVFSQVALINFAPLLYVLSYGFRSSRSHRFDPLVASTVHGHDGRRDWSRPGISPPAGHDRLCAAPWAFSLLTARVLRQVQALTALWAAGRSHWAGSRRGQASCCDRLAFAHRFLTAVNRPAGPIAVCYRTVFSEKEGDDVMAVRAIADKLVRWHTPVG